MPGAKSIEKTSMEYHVRRRPWPREGSDGFEKKYKKYPKSKETLE